MSADTVPETALALPASKPVCVADLDLLVHARGHYRNTAHIPDPHGDDPRPLCGLADAYHGAKWVATPPTTFSNDPDTWLSLCKRCLIAYDREVSE